VTAAEKEAAELLMQDLEDAVRLGEDEAAPDTTKQEEAA